MLGLLLAVIIGGAELWRRTIFRYVRDARRRYQYLLLRKIVFWCVIAVLLVVSFATELSSIATFAGLITAGVAVALQNVIVSIVAYFFLIGKYGIRVGDRVQVAGITGEVVEIGLVRFHLLELVRGGEKTASGTSRRFLEFHRVPIQCGLFQTDPRHELRVARGFPDGVPGQRLPGCGGAAARRRGRNFFGLPGRDGKTVPPHGKDPVDRTPRGVAADEPSAAGSRRPRGRSSATRWT